MKVRVILSLVKSIETERLQKIIMMKNKMKYILLIILVKFL